MHYTQAQSKLAMEIYECTWTFMGFHGKKHGFSWYSGTMIIGPLLGWTKTGQIGKMVTLSDCQDGHIPRFHCSCILTIWKLIDFHVNQSLANNGNEQFVWECMSYTVGSLMDI